MPEHWLKLTLAIIGGLLTAALGFSAVMWDNAIETLIDHEQRITRLESKP